MKALVTMLALMVLSGSAVAADKPNFSGLWKMNAAKSNYGQLPAPEMFIRKIDHTEPSISIVEEQRGQGTTPESIRKMKTDGVPVVATINGAAVTLSSKWEGAALLAQTSIEAFGVMFKDKMTLSVDGKEMTSVVQVDTAQGAIELKIVFERQ
jgi:hypothetical protein